MYSATGRRKSAVARVRLTPGTGRVTVNGRDLPDYLPVAGLQQRAMSPLTMSWLDGQMDVKARVHGGGTSGQASALRHGIARAVAEAEPGLREGLKRAGFLTRDPRVKERRKAGLKKARKRPQFSKR